MAQTNFSNDLQDLAALYEVNLQATVNSAQRHFRGMDESQLKISLANAHAAITIPAVRFGFEQESTRVSDLVPGNMQFEQYQETLENHIAATMLLKEINKRIRLQSSSTMQEEGKEKPVIVGPTEDSVYVRDLDTVGLKDIFPGPGKVPETLDKSMRQAANSLGIHFEEFPFGDPAKGKSTSFLGGTIRHAIGTEPYEGQTYHNILSCGGGLSAKELQELKDRTAKINVGSGYYHDR